MYSVHSAYSRTSQLVKNAITWPFIQDGIPIFYYGQEQGYTGGADPANREACVFQWHTAYVFTEVVYVGCGRLDT